MKLKESLEDLEAISKLEKPGKVRSVDAANQLQVSKPKLIMPLIF